MTTPLSLTSSRYTGAAARRSLERVSVVSSITSCPIHASGILSSEALGLSLSITASSSFRSCNAPASVGYLYRKLLTLRLTVAASRMESERQSFWDSGRARHEEIRLHQERGFGFSNVWYNAGCAVVVPLVGGKER